MLDSDRGRAPPADGRGGDHRRRRLDAVAHHRRHDRHRRHGSPGRRASSRTRTTSTTSSCSVPPSELANSDAVTMLMNASDSQIRHFQDEIGGGIQLGEREQGPRGRARRCAHPARQHRCAAARGVDRLRQLHRDRPAPSSPIRHALGDRRQRAPHSPDGARQRCPHRYRRRDGGHGRRNRWLAGIRAGDGFARQPPHRRDQHPVVDRAHERAADDRGRHRRRVVAGAGHVTHPHRRRALRANPAADAAPSLGVARPSRSSRSASHACTWGATSRTAARA